MVAEVADLAARSYAGEGSVPYPRSWLDRLFDRITALPGPTWLAYALLVIPSVLISNSALWLSGLSPWGQLDPAQVYWGTTTVLLFAAAHHLRNAAAAAFDRFRPALGNGVADPERTRYEFTVMPGWPILLITIALLVSTPVYYLADPVAFAVEGLQGAGLVVRTITEGLTSVVFIAIAFQSIRQLRTITRLHAAADQVDPFRPLPLYAFARLTAQVGIVLVLFIAGGAFVNPAALESSAAAAVWAPWLIGTPIVAAFVFVVPLFGMHGRLVAEKDRLETAADGRVRDLIGELNEAIDGRETDRVEALDRTLAALRHEREVLARLPTWPWDTGTIRGFGSALLLPIALFLAQRALSAALGD